MNSPKNYYIRRGWILILLATMLTVLPLTVMAADGHVPFFAGKTGSPNVMILFDNSNSMEYSPHFRPNKDGEIVDIYRPNTYWRRGVTVNPDCNNDGIYDDPCIAEDSGGRVIFDESKHITTDTTLILPGQAPPNLPGLSAAYSTVTRFQSSSACPYPNNHLICSDRIYDSNVNWSSISSWPDFIPYRFWKVKVTNKHNNSVQFRSINSRNSSSGFWRMMGDDLEYNPDHIYTYEIVGALPGEVTAEQTNQSRVFDRNFDWSKVLSWSDFATTYRHKILEVYAGTNAGEQRAITHRNVNYGFWTVDSDFPYPLDYTTRYRILGAADDNKRARGGNHPDSRMYQAKLALSKFLTSDAIKTTDTDPITGTTTERYLMNIGFATFLQVRNHATKAQYFRKRGVEHPLRFEYLYRANLNHSATTYNSTGCVNGVPPSTVNFTPWWGTSYTNISSGGTVDRIYRYGTCRAQTIRYKVTITCSPSDALPDRVRIRTESNNSWTDPSLAGTDPYGNDQWGYTWFGWRTFNAPDGYTACADWSPPDPLWGNRHLVEPGEHCYEACRTLQPWTETPFYETHWRTTQGNLNITDPDTPGYINRNPAPSARYIVTPYAGHCDIPGNDWLCRNPNPDDMSGDGRGDWTLVTSYHEPNLIDVPIHRDGRIGTITSEIFDYSEFTYPGRTGESDHPHGWSYRKMERNLDGRLIWPDSIQPYPFFPADTGNDFSNDIGDDQIVFINLPRYDPTDANKGDDLAGANILRLLNHLNLARIEYPRDRRFVHTMAPINKNSLTVNEPEHAGAGTPLAATLANARKYFTSYIKQDPFSLGGCRKNYIILLTDGTETAGGNPAYEAAALQNLIVKGERRPIKVYVVGFGMNQVSKVKLNKIAAAGGSGSAFFADDVDELVEILAHDITSDILSDSFSRSKVTITRGGLDAAHGLTLYNAHFDWPIWRGHLNAWQLHPENVYATTGELIHRAGEIRLDAHGRKVGEPHWADGCAGWHGISAAGDPNAGCIMAESNLVPGSPPYGPSVRRTLFTTNDGSRISFNPANASYILPLLGIATDDINNDGTAGNMLDAKTVINYIHHPGFDNANYVGSRDRNWPLADIYNSSPTLVMAPPAGNCLDLDGDGSFDIGSWSEMAGYCVHANNHKNRHGMLYFGTNGGLIQAITSGKPGVRFSGGREKWGYIPSFVLPKLKEIQFGHRFTMDLTIMASEVDTSIGLTGAGWKTMLVAGQRRGGRGYIALNVTDPANPIPMWEFTDGNLGQTWSRPSLARILINGEKTSVIIFGGGYSAYEDIGNRLFIIRASDGYILREITVGSRANDVPSQILTMPYLINHVGTVVDYRTNLAKLPDGTEVDYSGRSTLTEVAYFGDTSGEIWRLDGLNTESGVAWNPVLVRLYRPDPAHARPIFYPPVLTDIKRGSINDGVMSGCVRRLLAFGTGDEHNPIGTKRADYSPLIDYFFEIKDDGRSEGVDNESKLNWRLSLGMQLPSDNGFLLKPNGDRAKKDHRYILSKHIFIINKIKYDAEGWSIDRNYSLIAPGGQLAALAGEYRFKNSAGDLYSDVGLTNQIAVAGSYIQVDFSLWLTDSDGYFYDSEDGVRIINARYYRYDNNGYWVDDGGNRKLVNDNHVKLIENPGEKVLATPVGHGGYIHFTTYTPEGGCAAGTSFFYGLKASTCEIKGGGTGTITVDIAGNIFYSAPRRRIALGQGITGGVTLGGGMAYVSIGKEVIGIPAQVGITRLRYWRQN